MIKTINDLDKMYTKGVAQLGDEYICPVCEKSYKTKKGAENHIEKKDCYDLKTIFQHTQTELMAYQLYKTLIESVSPDTIADIRTFKKSPYYNGCVRFIVFSNINQLADQKETYLNWLIEFKNFNRINSILPAAVKESNLREFYFFLQQFPQFIDNEKFYSRYKDSLITDGEFFIRSLEKSKIAVSYILGRDDFPFEQVMASLELDYQIRFEDLANRILTQMEYQK